MATPQGAQRWAPAEFVSVEDDHNELHRRFVAAMNARFPNCSWRQQYRSVFEEGLRFVDLRGCVGIGLGDYLREQILSVVERVRNPGLILLDPLSRLLPPDVPTDFLNSQVGAGILLGELDALRTESGCTVLAAHHTNKDAIRAGTETKAGAATGSQQLVDLSRWVLALAPIEPKGKRQLQ